MAEAFAEVPSGFRPAPNSPIALPLQNKIRRRNSQITLKRFARSSSDFYLSPTLQGMPMTLQACSMILRQAAFAGLQHRLLRQAYRDVMSQGAQQGRRVLGRRL